MITAAGVGFAFWHGALGVVVCSLVLILGLLFALFLGHGIFHIWALWQFVKGRGRNKKKK